MSHPVGPTVRVLLALAGIATVPQFVVRDGGGRFVARVGLALPGLRLVIEYDGAWHGDTRQFARDPRRLAGSPLPGGGCCS